MALPHGSTSATDRNAEPSWHREVLVLAVALTAGIMAIFDLFVVDIAMPDIRAGLHVGDAAVKVLVSALITGGRLGDRPGSRRMFATGTAGFPVASLLCALAQTPGELVAARIVQAAACACLASAWRST